MSYQWKRVGRLRLLLTALVATTVSVVGGIGATAANAADSTGTLEICKAASGSGVSGTFGFTVAGRSGTIEVPVGGCSFPITLPAGTATVTEVERAGFTVSAIDADPSGRLVESSRTARTAKVTIVAGDVSNQTILTFTNKVTPKGFIEVCKSKPAGDTLSGDFNFTVNQTGSTVQTVTVPVGSCSPPIQLLAGTATVTEVARTGTQLVGVTTTPSDRLVGTPDLTAGTATVRIVAGDLGTQTIVTFTNKTVPQSPQTGRVKICKVAGAGVTSGTTFSFTLATNGTKAVDVKAGSCSFAEEVPVGNVSVTEKATTGLRVSDIRVEPASALGTADTTAGTVTVSVQAGAVTEVFFTNEMALPGTLKVCKVAGNGVAPRTEFSFTVGTTPVTVQAGFCSSQLTVPAGNLAVTEAATPGLQVTDITVAGAGALVSKNLAARTVTVNVASNAVTEVVFTNSKPPTPVTGCVLTQGFFKNHPDVVAHLVPAAGLSIGGDMVKAAQVSSILKAAQGNNFGFKLESQLITTLLNQLSGASTPTAVQTAINAAQLLISQYGGALLDSTTINTLAITSRTTVTFNGQLLSASQLVDILSGFNEGQAQGGPRTCDKDKS
jgi:hypothetical protein